ncbi:MAG: IS110 family transposase [Verrucomicrobiota bacterium]|nr:IS110 family transposase [Verrucomicrobiota bacterium]
MKSLPVLDSKAAAIDVGSEKLHVSIAGEPPKVFGTFTGDLESLRHWLLQQSVRTVAMEATGVYWLYLYEALEAAGLEVVVVNGRHVQNVPGRKTDMADCQWLATLHAHGLLRGGFVPPGDIRRLQDYQRLRSDHIIGAAAQVQKMQQALERMNIKFHDVISDLTGVSGLKVVRAILAGERRPGELLALCDEQIRKKKSERVKESLRGCWKAEQLFALRQALELWETYQQKVADCDRELEKLLQAMAGPTPPPGDHAAPLRLAPARALAKNTPAIERFQELLARICGGRDATQIPGLGTYLVLQLISEVGTDMTRWPSEKHFASWLGLAGGHKQSGKRKGYVKAHRNRAGRMFCAAAFTLARSVDKALGGFYRRLRGRIGGLAANVALARKLALLFYRLLRYGLDYVEKGLKSYEAKVLETETRLLRKLAKKQGFTLIPSAVN